MKMEDQTLEEKLRILVVEDKAENIAAARAYFDTRTDIEVDYAVDFVEAHKLLLTSTRSRKYDGALIDCFFPHSSHTNIRHEYINELLHVAISAYVEEEGLSEYPKWKGLAKEYYFRLRDAMYNSESNQPLGILLADKTYREGIPFRLVTSEGHHGYLVDSVCTYQRWMGWPEIVDDAYGKKDTADFWKKAYEDELAYSIKFLQEERKRIERDIHEDSTNPEEK
ncbi:MAG: hypothetical protein ABIE94_05075 [archaeon]